MGTSEFFPNNRRQLDLKDWRPLLNAQSEKRIRLDLQMPLTGQNILSMPTFIEPAFEKMDVEESAIGEIDLLNEIEGITFEAFSTDIARQPIEIDTLGLNLENVQEQLGRSFVRFTNATLRSFKLVRVKDTVCLEFTLTVKADAGLVLWAHQYHGGTFWAQFTHSTLKIEAKPSSDQMQLTEPALLAGSEKKKSPAEDCGYTDGNGMRCLLAVHDGEHEMSPISEGAVVERAKSRTTRERDAVAAGKPRGFAN